jgi:hypothetical protein
VVPAFRDVANVFKLAYPLMTYIDDRTGALADHSGALRFIIEGLIGAFVAYKFILLAVNGVLKAQAFWNGIAELSTLAFTDATNGQKVALVLYKGVQWAVIAATKAWTAAQWLLDAAIWAGSGPIGLIVIGVAVLAAGIIWAYKNVGWFRDGVNWLWDRLKDLGGWIKNNWEGIVGYLLNPFQAVLDTWHALQTAWEWFMDQGGGPQGPAYTGPAPSMGGTGDIDTGGVTFPASPRAAP